MSYFKIHQLVQKLLAALFLAISCISCQKESSQFEGTDIDQPGKDADELYQTLMEVGFDEEHIKDIGNYYQVADWLFDKNHTDAKMVEEYFTERSLNPDRQVEQARTDYLVSNVVVEALEVYADVSVTQQGYDNWSAAVMEAMYEWSNISDTKVAFSRVGNNTPGYQPDIIIRSDNGLLNNNTIASAKFPTSSGSPGWEILVNLDFNSNATISAGTKKYNMVHELGHCIGFRHTNWQQRGEPSAIQITGTPTTDGVSVMNGGTALSSWNGFSYYDRAAVRQLYSYGSNDHIIQFPEGKMRRNNNYIYNYSVVPDESDANDAPGYNGTDINVQWNASSFTSSSVDISIYYRGTLVITHENVPNIGSRWIKRKAPSGVPSQTGPYQLRIHSNSENKQDYTACFNWYEES